MGFKTTYRCPACHYDTITSGSPDRGRYHFTEPYICRDCEIQMDLTVKFYDLESRKYKEVDLRCRQCHSKNLEKWDIEKKPCPKCNCPMEVDPGGLRIRFD